MDEVERFYMRFVFASIIAGALGLTFTLLGWYMDSSIPMAIGSCLAAGIVIGYVAKNAPPAVRRQLFPGIRAWFWKRKNGGIGR